MQSFKEGGGKGTKGCRNQLTAEGLMGGGVREQVAVMGLEMVVWLKVAPKSLTFSLQHSEWVC